MEVIEKSQIVQMNDIVVIEDEDLKIKWFIDVERLDGKLISCKETLNPQFLYKQGFAYVGQVYGLAVENIK
jgi:hypothetical protein